MPMVNQGPTSPAVAVPLWTPLQMNSPSLAERDKRMESRVHESIESIGDHSFFTAKKFNTHFQRRLIASIVSDTGVAPRHSRGAKGA
jgi:hypothetical protein